MDVKGLLKLLQKVENKDTNIQYVGAYGNTFPITGIEIEVGYLILKTESTGAISLRKLVSYLLTVDDNTRVMIKLAKGNYRRTLDITSSGNIRILTSTLYENPCVVDNIRYSICVNCMYRRCAILCKVAIQQYCDMYGFRILR